MGWTHCNLFDLELALVGDTKSWVCFGVEYDALISICVHGMGIGLNMS